MRPLGRRTGFHTLDRWLYNAGVVLRPPRDTDLVLGVDLDGFLWARWRTLPFVASLKGIIADELKNERGRVRALLTVQARWEQRKSRRADLVMVTSRYSADVAAARVRGAAGAARGGAGAHRSRGVGRPVLARPRRPRGGPGGALRGPHVPAQADRRTCCAPPASSAPAFPASRCAWSGRGRSGRRSPASTPSWASATRWPCWAISPASASPRSTSTPPCSACRRCRRDSASCSWRRWPPSCRWWPVGSPRSRRSCSTASPACSVSRATRARSPALIERLIADSALARGLGREGRRRALGFTPRHVAERFLHAVHSSQRSPGTAGARRLSRMVYATRKFTFSAGHRYWRPGVERGGERAHLRLAHRRPRSQLRARGDDPRGGRSADRHGDGSGGAEARGGRRGDQPLRSRRSQPGSALPARHHPHHREPGAGDLGPARRPSSASSGCTGCGSGRTRPSTSSTSANERLRGHPRLPLQRRPSPRQRRLLRRGERARSTGSASASTATTTSSRSRCRGRSIPPPACRSTSASSTAAVKAAVLDRVDHYDLSATVPALAGVITTGREPGPHVLGVARGRAAAGHAQARDAWWRPPTTCSSTAASPRPRGDGPWEVRPRRWSDSSATC